MTCSFLLSVKPTLTGDPSNLVVLHRTALLKLPLHPIPIDPIHERVGKWIERNRCVFCDELRKKEMGRKVSNCGSYSDSIRGYQKKQYRTIPW